MSCQEIIASARDGAWISLPLVEWSLLLDKAVPPSNPVLAQMLADYRLGASRAAGSAQVAVMASQAAEVLKMIPGASTVTE